MSHLTQRVRRSPELVRWVASSPTPLRDGWLAARMLAWAIVLPVLKHALSLPALVRLAWTPRRSPVRHAEREQRFVRLADLLARGTNLSSRGACLQRSLLAYRFLSELGADPLLYVAFARHDRALAGHAWVVVDGRAIAEAPAVADGFTPAIVFGAGGRAVTPPAGEVRP